jgi:histidine triad (HIT) family protein
VSGDCFFCRFLAGEESDDNRLADVVLRTPTTTAFVSPRTWPANAGNAIVIPNAHVRDLESCPDDLLGDVFASVKRVAAAMREAYGCESTSLREHNGAAAGQEVDHLHVHVFPRYDGDLLYERTADHRFAPPEERAAYAERLKGCLTP